MKSIAIALGTAAALGAGAAQAATTFDFSYQFDDFATVAGTLEGTVSGDILTITSVDAVLTSTASGALEEVVIDTDGDDFDVAGNFFTVDPATVALDGSGGVDVYVGAALVGGGCFSQIGFCLISDINLATYVTPNFAFEGTYDPDNGSLTAIEMSPVPLPASLPLLAAGFGLVGAVAARRRKAA